MAKKFLRGVTGVDNIENFDMSLTNVNDLISDGENTYVHTKKGKDELYYNITNAVNKVQSSDNTLTITKQNDTISISNKSLATKEELATKQDTLMAGDGIKLNNNTISISNKSLATKEELATKQDTLMAGDGIKLNNNTISLIHTPESTVDCNEIITTQYLKVGYDSKHLPPEVDMYGVLMVVRIGDVVVQTYQDLFKTKGRYIRTGYNVNTNTIWNQWEKIVTEPTT